MQQVPSNCQKIETKLKRHNELAPLLQEMGADYALYFLRALLFGFRTPPYRKLVVDKELTQSTAIL